MTFFAFGLNCEQASVAIREAFALSSEASQNIYQSLRLSPDAELVLLSTCNRTEAYLYGSEADKEQIKVLLAERAGQTWPQQAAFHYQDEEAIRHVLEVTAGLRSQVLGDNQILSQVKDAYRLAVEEDSVDTVVHRLMHTAFRTAKQVVTQTALGEGAASISSLAVNAACRYFADEAGSEAPLKDCRALLLGVGEMGQGVMHMLKSQAPAALSLANRSRDRAEQMARQVGADVVAWEDRYEVLEQYDLVIVATGASEPVLKKDKMLEETANGSNRLLVDIALPRNIDPAIDQLPGNIVLDLDTLNQRLVNTEEKRAGEVPKAQAICEDALSDFVSWVFHQQALQPAIATLRGTFEAIRRQEVDRHHDRLGALDREELDQITRSIMQKLLAVPIVRLKDAANNDLDLAQRVELLHTLFAQPDKDSAADINELEECPYVRDHMENNKMWRPVAKYMRAMAEADNAE